MAMSQTTPGCVTRHASVTHFRPILGKVVEVTLVTSPKPGLGRGIHLSFFFTKNTGAPMGGLEGCICPLDRFSLRNSFSSFCSAGDRGKVWACSRSVSGVRLIAWSQGFHGGSLLKASLENTSAKSW